MRSALSIGISFYKIYTLVHATPYGVGPYPVFAPAAVSGLHTHTYILILTHNGDYVEE